MTGRRDVETLKRDLTAGRIRGFVVIPQDFTRRFETPGEVAALQVVTDGSLPNTASFIGAYAEGVRATWAAGQGAERGNVARQSVEIAPRFWFNPELASHYFLIPGSIAIVMTMIGTLLTALVVAREWERGTMEAIMATPVGMPEFLASKVIPYFLLGLGSMTLCALLAIFLFGVPFRGSPLALLALASAFLVPALGQGLLISAVTKNQFVASQVALISAFLPAMMLSGFLFEIASMPRAIRGLTYHRASALSDSIAAVGIPGGAICGGCSCGISRFCSASACCSSLLRFAPPSGGSPDVGPALRHGDQGALGHSARSPRADHPGGAAAVPTLRVWFREYARGEELRCRVYNRDGGAASREFVERLGGSPNVGRVVSLGSPGAVREAIDGRSVIAVVMFDQEFSANVAAHRAAVIQAVFDGRRSNAAQIVSGYLERIAADMGAQIAADPREQHVPLRSQSIVANWFNPNLDYIWFTMPGLIVVISMVSGLAVTAQSVARERELGTFDQLMVAPLRVYEILAGKMVPPLLVGIVNATVYLLLIPTVFGVPLTGGWRCSMSRSCSTCWH